MTWSQVGLATSTFLASAVEMVEAVTIVLAMGLTRGWRSAFWGTVLALAALTAITVVSGYALITWLPDSLLQFLIGTLLLIFGLQWLRKAILRSSGLKAVHDEEAIFQEELAAARAAGTERKLGLDWFGFVVTFKGVFLEGLEIVFIVITFGLNADNVPLAATGAIIAATIVLIAAIILHKPLSRVPENTIKFAVGLLLSTFGTFWAVEGLGVFQDDKASIEWPGGDLALLVLLVLWCGFSWLAVRILSPYGTLNKQLATTEGALVKFIVGFGQFWWDFIVGDEWKIAAGVLASLVVGAILVAKTAASDTAISILVSAAIITVVTVSITGPARQARSRKRINT